MFNDATNDQISITETTKTLSDGSTGEVYKIETTCLPPDHSTGPFCPTDTTQTVGWWDDPGYGTTQINAAYLSYLKNTLGWTIVDASGKVNVDATASGLQKARDQEANGWTYDQAVSNGITNTCIAGVNTAQNRVYYIPKYPKKASSATSLEDFQFVSGLGISLNGVPFFPTEPVGRIMAYQNIAPLDDEGGHNGFAYDYHYHRAWDTTYNTSTKISGYALDGFPVYGEKEPDGSTPADLDASQGHEYGSLGYHYHAQGNKIIGSIAGVYYKQ